MFAVIFNTITVLIGSILGTIFKKGIPERYTSPIMAAIGIFSVVIGLQGAFKTTNALILLVSTVLGLIIGTVLNIDGLLNLLGQKVEERFSSSGKGNISKAFVSSTLLFCVGSMTVVGSLQAGTTGDNTMLITKSIMDLISSTMIAVTMGFGVILSSFSVFIIEGLFVILAGLLAPVLTDTMIAEMTAVGSVAIIGIGTNLMEITNIKVADYLPGIVLAPFITILFTALGIN